MSDPLPGFGHFFPEPSTQVDEVVRCQRCHRVLKDPASRERGYGRTCWAKAEQAFLAEMVAERRREQEHQRQFFID